MTVQDGFGSKTVDWRFSRYLTCLVEKAVENIAVNGSATQYFSQSHLISIALAHLFLVCSRTIEAGYSWGPIALMDCCASASHNSGASGPSIVMTCVPRQTIVTYSHRAPPMW